MQEPRYYGQGNSDGVIEKEEYFTCAENCGLFLSVADLKPLLVPHTLQTPIEPPPPSSCISSSQHCYLLLQDMPPYSRGAVLEEKVEFKGHSHLWRTYNDIIYPYRGVGALTTEECALLDAIGGDNEDNAARYAVYSTPGQLAWGVGLKVGDNVLARLPGGEEYALSIIQSVGAKESCLEWKSGLVDMSTFLSRTYPLL